MKRVQVRELLLAFIEGLPPGEMLPSERTLSAEMGVSRPTLRAAIEDLAREDRLTRSHGRGTFIKAGAARSKITQELAGNFAAPPAEGDWRSTVVEFTSEPAGARLGQRLRVSPSTELLYVGRVRIVDGAPMAIERIRIPARLVPGIARADFESGNLYQILRLKYEVVAADAVQTTEPTVTDAQEAALLTVPVHSPALLFERTTHDASGQVVEYTRSIYRGDRYRITTHLTFDSNSG